MPIMFDSVMDISNSQSAAQLLKCQTFYGHHNRIATKCQHAHHPSAPANAPLCPACTISKARTKTGNALNGLVARGGPSTPASMRDRMWRRAMMRYDIAKQRQAKVRGNDQLRLEREQAWDAIHLEFYLGRAAVADPFQNPAECPVCVSLVACFPTRVSVRQPSMEVAWWERPCNLAPEPMRISKQRHQVQKVRSRPQRSENASPLRNMIQQFREETAMLEADKQTWEARHRTECAVRRKHGLGEEFGFDPEFWDSPISGILSRKHHQHVQENERMAARQKRGNTLRPTLSHSSLSNMEIAEEGADDEAWLAEMQMKESLENLEKETKKVAGEVGYLYFVGESSESFDWREDFLRSNRNLIYRTTSSGSETDCSSPESGGYDDMEDVEIRAFVEMDGRMKGSLLNEPYIPGDMENDDMALVV